MGVRVGATVVLSDVAHDARRRERWWWRRRCDLALRRGHVEDRARAARWNGHCNDWESGIKVPVVTVRQAGRI
eukprot:scaffold128495_cov75-Phaeocystis_antarctica.AAC.1